MFWSLHKTKILSILLMLSVALNIALGSWAGGMKTAQMRPDIRERIANFRDVADHSTKKEARAFMRQNRSEIRKIRQSVQKKRQEIDRLIGQENVDKQALAKSMEELRALSLQSMEMMHEMTLEVFADMPIEKRQELMKRRKKDFRKNRAD